MKFRKIISILAVTIITFMLSTNAINAAEESINKDYTIMDVTYIQKCVAELCAPTLEDVKEYDFNKSGALDVMDATYLQRVLVEQTDATETQSTEETVSQDVSQTEGTTQPVTEVTEPITEPTESPSMLDIEEDTIVIGVNEVYYLKTVCDVECILLYSSSNSNVAVDDNGVIKGVAAGTAIVQVETENGLSDVCTIVVKNTPESISLNKKELTLGMGEEYGLIVNFNSGEYANNDNIEYNISDKNVVTVTEIKNDIIHIKAQSSGTAKITFKTYNGKTANCIINVKPMAQSLKLNANSLMLGIGETFDLNSFVPSGTAAYFRVYSSSNASVAKAEASGGLVTAIKAGSSTVKCVLNNGVYAECRITVKAAPAKASLSATMLTKKVGDVYTIAATTDNGSYSFNSSWSSSNTSIVSIEKSADNKAVITAKALGTATITFKTYNGKTATCKVTVSGSSVKCLDVSTWQGDIDFNKVKSSGYNYVIIRAGYGNEASQKDNKFESNYKKAKAAGLKVGAYWFSYAMSPSEAIQEAKACLSCLGNKKFDMPIYFDMEYSPAITQLSNTTLTNMAINFCETVKKSGHSVGVYASASVFAYSYTINYDKLVNYGYSIWNAEWNDTYSIKCDVWQYTDCAKVNGISTNVDCSYIYNLNIVK